jgi:hypothetical protein
MPTAAHTAGRPHQHPHEPSTSSADWVEAIAVGLSLIIAIVVLAGILALLIII